MGSGYYQQYVVKCYLFNKNQYARIKIVTGQEITDSYALQFILNNADTSVKAYETHTESTIYKFQLIDNLLCTRQISQNPYPIRVLPS